MKRRLTSNALVAFLFVLGMCAAMAISLLLIIINLQPPASDVQQLFLFMSGSGGASVILMYGLYRTGALVSFKLSTGSGVRYFDEYECQGHAIWHHPERND